MTPVAGDDVMIPRNPASVALHKPAREIRGERLFQ
jgi:hypothetical protein